MWIIIAAVATIAVLAALSAFIIRKRRIDARKRRQQETIRKLLVPLVLFFALLVYLKVKIKRKDLKKKGK